jgi:hypothetical protein
VWFQSAPDVKESSFNSSSEPRKSNLEFHPQWQISRALGKNTHIEPKPSLIKRALRNKCNFLRKIKIYSGVFITAVLHNRPLFLVSSPQKTSFLQPLKPI